MTLCCVGRFLALRKFIPRSEFIPRSAQSGSHSALVAKSDPRVGAPAALHCDVVTPALAAASAWYFENRLGPKINSARPSKE